MERVVNRLLIVTAAVALLFGGLAFLFRNSEHDSLSKADVTLPLCEYIDIELLRLDVTVLPTDADEIRVTYIDDVPINITTEYNKITISESDDFVISLFSGTRSDLGLYVYLPREIYRSVRISTGSGDVNVGRVDSELLSVATDSGDILWENACCLGNISSSTGNARIVFDTVVTETTVMLRRGDAEIILPEKSSTSLDFQTDTGECVTDLVSGEIYGSFVYSFNGGSRVIHASIDEGTLTVSEKARDSGGKDN